MRMPRSFVLWNLGGNSHSPIAQPQCIPAHWSHNEGSQGRQWWSEGAGACSVRECQAGCPEVHMGHQGPPAFWTHDGRQLWQSLNCLWGYPPIVFLNNSWLLLRWLINLLKWSYGHTPVSLSVFPIFFYMDRLTVFKIFKFCALESQFGL